MNRIYLWPALALLTLALNSACRTQRGTDAALNDEQTDLLAAAMPPGLMSLVVPTADIPKYVEPATGDNGIPASLNGIWWTDAKSIQFVISFKNAVWNPKTRTASLVYIGPGTYVRRPGTEGTAPSKTGVSRDDFNTFQGYDIIFNESLDQATMLVAQSVQDERQTFHQDTGDFTLNFVKNGVWRRDTPGKDSYFLKRIVDEKGNKEPVFEDFLKVFGPQAQIFKSSFSLDINARNIKVPVKAGIETYVSLKGWYGEVYRDFDPYNVTFKAPFSIQVKNFGAKEMGSKQFATEPMKVILRNTGLWGKPEMIVALTAEQDGEVEIMLDRAEALPILKMGEATSVQLKANTLTYFRLEKNPGTPAFEIKVQSDSPTDILFNRNRSAGRSGEKQNSLWGTTSTLTNDDAETITLKAREDSRVTVEVVKKDLKVRNLGSLKRDGSWQEASLESMNTVDFWLIDVPDDSNERRFKVEIEEIGSKRSVPDLYMTNAGSSPIGLESYVRFGILNRDARAATTDEKQAFARTTDTLGSSSIIIYYGWPQHLERLPKYRLRATPIKD